VSGNARVCGDALVYGNARVSGNALVYDNAQLDSDPIIANRSDHYQFTAFPCQDGVVRLTAGCRFFTFEEARAHWNKTRANTQLGEETTIILDNLERLAQFKWGKK